MGGGGGNCGAKYGVFVKFQNQNGVVFLSKLKIENRLSVAGYQQYWIVTTHVSILQQLYVCFSC